MKFAIVAVVALAAVAQGFVLPIQEDVEVGGNMIDNIILSAAEFVRQYLKKPFVLADVPEQTIVDSNLNIKLKLSNIQVSKADDFVFEQIATDLAKLGAKFQVKLPQPTIEADFTVDGEILSKKVSGTGHFSGELTNMDQSGYVEIQMVNHAIQIQDLTLDYTLDSAKFSVAGLNVEGMTGTQLNDFLNNNLLAALDAHKSGFCEEVASQVKTLGNQLLAGKTLAQIIDYLMTLVKQ